MEEKIKYYMGLPYTTMLQHYDDESGQYYVASIMELDGCHTHGETKEEALINVQEAMEAWIETKLEYGDPIPEPRKVSDNI